MAGPVRALLGNVTGLAHTRLALLGTELREELARSAWLLAGVCATIGLALLGLAFGAAAILVVVAPEDRAAAAAALALVFAGAAAWAAWLVRRSLAAGSLAFGSSLAELENDRRALVGQSAAQRTGLAEGASELMRLVSIGLLAYSIARRLTRRTP